jgi:hypothetical protein
VNADGSEYFEPWFIGKSKNPRCFKNINGGLLGIHYRFNKRKWMTGLICEEYLRWLDRKMTGRKVLLLMDNFSGHELGVELVELMGYRMSRLHGFLQTQLHTGNLLIKTSLRLLSFNIESLG